MTKIVSVIVPVYNSEKKLHRCIDSILSQSYTGFELILVDDGSTDTSGAICDEYAKKDSRVHVIHQKNSGASSARNRGLSAAQGDFLMFCDSDDVVSSLWIARLMQYADGETLPLGAYCHQPSQLGSQKELPVPAGEEWPSSRYYAFQQAGIAGFLWNSLFITDIVKTQGLSFREQHLQGDFNEDLLFTLQYIRCVKKIVYTGFTDYVYDTHDGSLSRSYSDCYFPKYQEKFQLWYAFLESASAKDDDLDHLAQTTLYHFLTALKLEFSAGNFRRFRQIVLADSMRDCLRLSDFPKENPRILRMLRKKAVFRLWILYILHSLKGR